MAEKSFKLEIVTPQKAVFNGEVTSFSAPGITGGFQVLYNHAPLLSAITTGKSKFQDTQGKVTNVATSGGFVEVKANHVVMLAETAELSGDIDIARAQEAKARAQKRLQEKNAEIDFERARAALARAINRLRIAQKG